MSSYKSIHKWAKEAQVVLRQGKLDAVKTNLTMIISQCREQLKREKK